MTISTVIALGNTVLNALTVHRLPVVCPMCLGANGGCKACGWTGEDPWTK